MQTRKAPGKSWTPPRGIALRRRAQRDTWVVEWRDEQRRQCQKSFKSREAAEMCARNLADTLRKSGREGLSGMEAAARREYLLIKAALGTASVSQLLAVWERHKGEVIGGRSELQLGDAASQYLTLRKDEGLGAERLQHVKLQLERLTSSLGVETPLIDLDATALRKWLAGLREDKGMSETTLMHYLRFRRTVHATRPLGASPSESPHAWN